MLESHFLHRCFTEELVPFHFKIGNGRSCDCPGSYLCNIVKLHTAILNPLIYQDARVKMCNQQKKTALLYPHHLQKHIRKVLK